MGVFDEMDRSRTIPRVFSERHVEVIACVDGTYFVPPRDLYSMEDLVVVLVQENRSAQQIDAFAALALDQHIEGVGNAYAIGQRLLTIRKEIAPIMFSGEHPSSIH